MPVKVPIPDTIAGRKASNTKALEARIRRLEKTQLEIGKFTAARAYLAAETKFAALTVVKIPTKTISFDPGENINTTNGYYVVHEEGYYQVNAQLETRGGTYCLANIGVNGSRTSCGSASPGTFGGECFSTVSDILLCKINDHIELFGYFNAETFLPSSTICNYLAVVRVA